MFIPARCTALALTAAATILTGCAATPERDLIPVPPTRTEAAAGLKGAAARCGLDGTEGVQLDAAGTSLTIDTKGPDEASGASTADVKCVLDALEVPSGIQSKMTLTTSTAESREAAWEGRNYSWSYDPSSWFRLTVTQG
ncbi:hypothetical protein LFT45_03960 [Arthrobacter sp. FW305-BF8]|uniref:hypothetical protein n=1 Tax=Arthrobacter sp. FW305-BF8 TaxID=2879617 RepID=UPI001F48B302|nr:hypothetical protein [Arthrobacter sp. FW305-BF8]UKA55108.1 hypothetical protein LFT45_03960 [Arthrobacter sp. FW305-BF8]